MKKINWLLIALFLAVSCDTPKQTESITPAGYSIMWKYVIKPEHREKFEAEYGADGMWVRLFSTSIDYKGSLLYKSEQEKDTYFLIDNWISKESYEAFKKENQDMYDRLSKEFEYLYNVEESVGSFHSVQ